MYANCSRLMGSQKWMTNCFMLTHLKAETKSIGKSSTNIFWVLINLRQSWPLQSQLPRRIVSRPWEIYAGVSEPSQWGQQRVNHAIAGVVVLQMLARDNGGAIAVLAADASARHQDRLPDRMNDNAPDLNRQLKASSGRHQIP